MTTTSKLVGTLTRNGAGVSVITGCLASTETCKHERLPPCLELSEALTRAYEQLIKAAGQLPPQGDSALRLEVELRLTLE